MLNEKEIERFELLEEEIHKLRTETKIQNLVISGLLNCLFSDNSKDHSLFYSAIREELQKVQHGSDMHHECVKGVERWVGKYNS
ncbi:hypothetical protein [Pantoea sp. SOD02]|uniref:hypothetical protein n=1 Tax=Pantoea sp. SOD02 TaxID=2970818 RepID=UPI0021572174|nr:hypothetical protein [Pantoea sp. SOD02]UVC28843.1 hypothetical protein NR302_16625 [Pantoea sp. SOD02]